MNDLIITTYYNGSAWEVECNVDDQGGSDGYKGVTLTTVPSGGGTVTLNPRLSKINQIFDGTVTLSSSYTINAVTTSDAVEGDEFWIYWNSNCTQGVNTVTIFSHVLTDIQALSGRIAVKAVYDGTVWKSYIMEDLSIPEIWERGSGIESAQQVNTTTANDASGVYSVSTGESTIASGQASFSTGKLTEANGNFSFSGGNQSQANGLNSWAFGNQSIATRQSQFSFSSGRQVPAVVGNYSQYSQIHPRVITTGNTPTELRIDGAGGTERITVPNNSLLQFTAKIFAVQTGGTSGTVGDSACWMISGVIRNIAGTTALLGNILYSDNTGATSNSAAQRIGDAAASTWTMVPTADNTNDALAITVTGQANKNIAWYCVMDCIDMKWA